MANQQQVYAINKNTYKLEYGSANLHLLKEQLKQDNKNEEDYLILGDFDMKHVSRIVYVDGDCIYNNVDFWRNRAVSLLDDYDSHTVVDVLGLPVAKDRYQVELNINQSRIASIEGISGEVLYNIEVAGEFISLFKEESVYTEFVNITPDELMAKLAPVVTALNTGSFREAKHIIQQMEKDSFLTEERIAKYVAMMDAADAIEYATSDETLFTTDNEPDDVVDDVYTRTYGKFKSDKKRSVKYILPQIDTEDKIIYLIRHSERVSDTSTSGDLTDNGVTLARNFGNMLVNGYETSSGNVNCEPNDAHYFSTDFARTKHTAQAIAEARGDTDYSSSTYENITLLDDLICGDKFWKGANTDLLKKYGYKPDQLSAEQLQSLGVSSVEEAIEKRQNEFEEITQQLIKLADKRLNVMITHDYFLYTYTGAAMYTDETCTDKDSVCGTQNYLDGVVIIIHTADKTYEIYPVDCTP